MSTDVRAALAALPQSTVAELLSLLAKAQSTSAPAAPAKRIAPIKAKTAPAPAPAPKPTPRPAASTDTRSWTYSHDVVSQYGSDCEVYINSRQPNKPRLVAKDLCAAIRSRK